jgi:hypothetical protein
MGGSWDAMTAPDAQSTPAADVAMPAADVPTIDVATALPVVAMAEPPVVVSPTSPADAADNVTDVAVNPTTPIRPYVAPTSEGPYVANEGASPGIALPEIPLSPSSQSQRLRALKIQSQIDDFRAETGERVEQAAATMSGGENMTKTDLGPEEQRFVDEGMLPPPQQRASSPTTQ